MKLYEYQAKELFRQYGIPVPEGATASTPEEAVALFKRFNRKMAIKAQVPVVPVALIGTALAMPRGQFYVNPTWVTVRVGEPIPTVGLTLDDRDRLVATVRERMRAMLRS